MVKRGPATDFELRVDGVCKFSYGLSREALPLAKAAGCHLAIWGGTGAPATAGEALEHLRRALPDLTARPDYFKALDPQFGAESYDSLTRMISIFEWACRTWPHAEIRYLNSLPEASSPDA
ncbi:MULTISPECIES: hypothetical protein [Pseudomonas]|uniref:hypothetical protein n=1 Tax=Pseudomonas TaxID=286 RepID=UPI00190F4F0F|nr:MULTISPECIES: hypothetical protein [Pseudomonas]MDU4255618.1 hypothetical protein [Pseudomonas sp.]